MSERLQKASLMAEALNTMTTEDAVCAMSVAKLGPRYLPVCPPDHQHVSEQHKAVCGRPGKSPTIAQWPQKATDDLATLRKWFGGRNRNVGMTLGGEVGVVGFDVDGKYGEERMNDLFDGDIPLTWQFSTPGGGMRFLFSVPKGQRLHKLVDAKSGALHEELALLADGQMTVIPPSRHQSGGQYQWMPGKGPGDLPLAVLPASVLAKMRSLCTRSERQKFMTGEGPDIPLRRRSSVAPTLSDPNLKELANKCLRVGQAIAEQAKEGCNEVRWHAITSMLVRSGFPNAALEFSRLSRKHDGRSEQRIREMEAEGDSAPYGPTRCVTLGCDARKIACCHGSVRKNRQTGTPSNSPAAFLSGHAARTLEKPTSPTDYARLLSDRYALEDGNLCFVSVNNDGIADYRPLANFVARIAKSITKDDGAERITLYEIDGVIIPSAKSLPPIRVNASEFENMKWPAIWGPEPNILPGNLVRDTVRHAIQSTASKAENEQVFAHLGWVKIEGQWKYLHAGGALGRPGIQVELDSRLKNYALPSTPSDPKKAMKASLRLLDVAPHRVTLVLWSLVFLSPLCELLREANLEPKFLVWLYGHTGSRKTTIAKLFLSHFGNLLEHPPASFKDTANAVERRGFDTKDSLLLIDDYHPTSSPQERKSMEQLAQQVLRGYGDRVARGPMKQDTSLRPDYPPRGMAIVTAEDMVSGGSSVARLFPAELRPAEVDLERLTNAQSRAHRLSEAMAGYLVWVEHLMNKPRDGQLQTLFAEKRNKAARLGVHGRLVEASSLLHVGLQFGLEYAEGIGAVSSKKKRQLLDEAWEVFLSAASEQGEKVSEVNATTRFVTIVSQLLANQTIYCDSLHPAYTPKSNASAGNSTHVGWLDGSYFYFLPELIFNTVSQFLSRQGEQFPISPSTLWKELADAGMTHYEKFKENGKERRHLLVKKTILKQRQRLLWIKREILYEKTEDEAQSGKRKGRGVISSNDLEL